MSYISVGFAILTFICFLLFYFAPLKLKKYILLTASCVFYICSSKYLIILPVVNTLFIYFLSIKIDKVNEAFNAKKKELSKEERKEAKKQNSKVKKRICTVEIVLSFLLLAVFKYMGFFTGIINDISESLSLGSIPLLSLMVPLGISYYTLSIAGYAIDVYRGTLKAEKNYCKLLLFTVYFPHIVEGPIGNYKSFSSQLDKINKPDFETFMTGIQIVLFGLMKKMIIADRAGIAANQFFDNYEQYGFTTSLAGMILYAVNIYFDFSGCIDIVRGVSCLFGIELPENFRQPFFSKSVQEFWRRWHITLGDWIKKYIFYSVSMSKINRKIISLCDKIKNEYFKTTVPMFYALAFVWLFNGIWHGASWKYILYGVYYYIIICAGLIFEPLFEKICSKLKINREGKAFGIFRILRTSVLVVIGLTLFRADSTYDFIQIIKSVFVYLDPAGNISDYYNSINLSLLDFVIVVLFTGLMFFISYKKEKGTDFIGWFAEHKRARWILCTAEILVIIILGVYGSSFTRLPFVYAQF